MNSKKMSYFMLGLVGVLGFVILASVVMGDILLHKTSNKLANLKIDNQVIESQQTSLITANKDLQKYSELKSIAKQIVPQDKDQARATREIISLADQVGIKISSITFPASTLGQTPPKAAASTDDATATPKVITPSVTQVKAVEGIKGLYQLDITVVSDTTQPATYKQIISFLTKLEQNRRTAQVSQITILPDSLNRSGLNFTITVTVYIKP